VRERNISDSRKVSAKSPFNLIQFNSRLRCFNSQI